MSAQPHCPAGGRGRLLAAVGPALVAAPRAGGDDASPISEARPRGRPPSGVCGRAPFPQLVPSAGRGGVVVGRGLSGRAARLTGQLAERVGEEEKGRTSARPW